MPYDSSQDRTQGKPSTPYQARKAKAVTPSDTADLSPYAKAIYVGGAGDVRCILVDSSDLEAVTFVGMAVGWHPIQVRRVFATGTTATNIVAVWDDR